MRHVSDDERRARLAVRHALAPASHAGSPEAVVEAVVGLHATAPTTVYLSCWARGGLPEMAHLSQALYEKRTLVKQLAMRRTLFVFPRDLLGAVWGSAAARVASIQRMRMTKEIVSAGLAKDGDAWLERSRDQVLSALAEHPDGLSAVDLRKLLPKLRVKVSVSASAPWSASQILTYLGARADIVRGSNLGDWYTSRSRWTLTRHWLGDVPKPSSAAEGYRELVHRWLQRFGPGSEADIVWWLGATKAIVRAALAELCAVEVSLDHGGRGWLLPEDMSEAQDPGPWVALLPMLDSTVMGWQTRSFYIDRHRDQLFDSQGNAGTTTWVDGRVVGFWTHDDNGTVHLQLLERVSIRARRALESDASRLTNWLGGVRLPTIVRSPA